MENEKVYEAKVLKNEKNSNGFWVKLLVIVCLIAIGAAGMYGIITLIPAFRNLLISSSVFTI